MKETILKVISNIELAPNVYELKLGGDVREIRPGQFVELKVDGFFLRRPFGAADICADVLTVLYRVQGAGTDAMTLWKSGDTVNALVGLGNGFNLAAAKVPLLIGGGMGIAPLYYVAKAFYESGVRANVILGFKTKDEAFYVKEFEKIACVTVATDDGSLGVRGNVLDAVRASKINFDYYYACGPMVMMKHIKAFSESGELSLEARMGCGFGACMGCSIQTASGTKRVCKEGPVFAASEVIF